ALPAERAAAVSTYLGIALDKATDYNSTNCRWDSTRLKVVNTFDKHGYSLKWAFGEFDGARNLLPWAIDQVDDAYSGIAKLARGQDDVFAAAVHAPVSIHRGSAL